MTNRILKYSLLFLLMISVQSITAQKDFEASERDQIADNVNDLLERFVRSLEFDNTLHKSLVENYIKTYGDSLAIIKIDSMKQDRRNELMENISTNFHFKKDKFDQSILNFAFDSALIPAKELGIDAFVQKYVSWYDKVNRGENPLLYIYSEDSYQKNLRPLMRDLQIKDEQGGYSVSVRFEIDRLKFFYDTISEAMGRINTTGELPEFHENKNIQLSARVFFKKPANSGSYTLISIQKPGKLEQAFKTNELEELIQSSIIKNFELYANLSKPDQAPDPALSDGFTRLFDKPMEKSIECSLFFPPDICSDISDISAKQYIDMIVANYGYLDPIETTADYKSIELLSQTNVYYLFKLPVSLSIAATDDKYNSILEKTDFPAFFYIRVDYEKNLFSGKEDLTNATIASIASYDILPEISAPPKKGNWSASLSYKPEMLFLKTQGDFEVYNTTFSLSNAIGLSGQYYWYMKKDDRLDKERSLGVSAGIFYEMLSSSMEFTHFDREGISPGDNAFSQLSYADEIQFNLSDFSQELQYNTLSIPVKGHYKINLKDGMFADLSAGLKFAIPLQNSVDITSEGNAIYTGTKQVTFPNNNTPVTYHLEDLPSKGFTDYPSVLPAQMPETNSMITYLIIEPSISIPIPKTIENGFIDVGLQFQYGLNKLFNTNNQQYLVDSHGITNDVFSGGTTDKHFILGLSIGFRYFDEKTERAYKSIK